VNHVPLTELGEIVDVYRSIFATSLIIPDCVQDFCKIRIVSLPTDQVKTDDTCTFLGLKWYLRGAISELRFSSLFIVFDPLPVV
jgi:hypothetical protein